MPRHNRGRAGGWDHLLDTASSKERMFRQSALIRAYAWVEHALDGAAVAGPRTPIKDRIARGLSQVRGSTVPDRQLVDDAVSVRNAATHVDKVPGEDACLTAVSTLRAVWHTLSRSFVSEGTAIALARSIAANTAVQYVCLYGSLARRSSEANDIDLFVADDGTCSNDTFQPYGQGTFDAVTHTVDNLVALGIGTTRLEQCAKCRWLDIVMVDGYRFGHDREYTRKLCQAQPDPWFFVNIARDVTRYQPATQAFMGESWPFTDLAGIADSVEELGFL